MLAEPQAAPLLGRSSGRKKRRWKGAGRGRYPGGFVAIPHAVVKHPRYVALSLNARALLVEIAMQFKGNNNGDLCAPWRLMSARGFRSPGTLLKSKAELLDAGFICETRLGARPNKATLYAILWQSLDDCGRKLDRSRGAYPYGAWTLPNPAEHTRLAR